MKMVFTAPSVIPCDLLVTLLDVENIRSVINNERGSAIAGEALPIFGSPTLPWSWPQVWVADEDYERAAEIATEFQRGESEFPEA